MKTIGAENIEDDPTAFLRDVESGQTLVIVRAGRPVAEVRPIPTASSPTRPFGLCAGQFAVPDDFDEPLPPDIIESFLDL